MLKLRTDDFDNFPENLKKAISENSEIIDNLSLEELKNLREHFLSNKAETLSRKRKSFLIKKAMHPMDVFGTEIKKLILSYAYLDKILGENPSIIETKVVLDFLPGLFSLNCEIKDKIVDFEEERNKPFWEKDPKLKKAWEIILKD